MPPEILYGTDIPSLLARARAQLGEDARMMSIRRAPIGGFELHAEEGRAAWHGPRIEALRPEPTELAAGRGTSPRVFALVGPTGSGKTTTLAKLANHRDVFGGDAVGMLCLDTYRVGAVEQARAYAELSRLPLEVVYEARDVARARQRLRDCRVLLVDTAGRAPSRPGDLAEIRVLLAELNPCEVHLTLPAGLDARRARAVYAQHRSLGLTHVLATKVDEFPQDHVVRDLAAEHGLPMRWMTTGQEVPADLAWAGAPLPQEAA
jgi:flagellar biosynthesis protein FlhF